MAHIEDQTYLLTTALSTTKQPPLDENFSNITKFGLKI